MQLSPIVPFAWMCAEASSTETRPVASASMTGGTRVRGRGVKHSRMAVGIDWQTGDGGSLGLDDMREVEKAGGGVVFSC